MLSKIFQERLRALPQYSENAFEALQVQFFKLFMNGTYRFQTLTEARQLAFFLSYLCPEPPRVAVGLVELFVNAIEHGNLGITYEEKHLFVSEENWLNEIENRMNASHNRHKYVEVYVSKESDQVKFTIQDQGIGFDWETFMQDEVESSTYKHGRGILLAKLVSFDNLYYTQPGNVVTGIVKLINQA